MQLSSACHRYGAGYTGRYSGGYCGYSEALPADAAGVLSDDRESACRAPADERGEPVDEYTGQAGGYAGQADEHGGCDNARHARLH